MSKRDWAGFTALAVLLGILLAALPYVSPLRNMSWRTPQVNKSVAYTLFPVAGANAILKLEDDARFNVFELQVEISKIEANKANGHVEYVLYFSDSEGIPLGAYFIGTLPDGVAQGATLKVQFLLLQVLPQGSEVRLGGVITSIEVIKAVEGAKPPTPKVSGSNTET